jgi:hypothetical protein
MEAATENESEVEANFSKIAAMLCQICSVESLRKMERSA